MNVIESVGIVVWAEKSKHSVSHSLLPLWVSISSMPSAGWLVTEFSNLNVTGTGRCDHTFIVKTVPCAKSTGWFSARLAPPNSSAANLRISTTCGVGFSALQTGLSMTRATPPPKPAIGPKS